MTDAAAAIHPRGIGAAVDYDACKNPPMLTLAVRRLILMAALAAAGPAVADENFRCGSRLVTPGMSQSQVLQFCGSPLSNSEQKVPVRSGKQVVGETTMSRWTYESHGSTRVLVFDLDVLKSIE